MVADEEAQPEEEEPYHCRGTVKCYAPVWVEHCRCEVGSVGGGGGEEEGLRGRGRGDGDTIEAVAVGIRVVV